MDKFHSFSYQAHNFIISTCKIARQSYPIPFPRDQTIRFAQIRENHSDGLGQERATRQHARKFPRRISLEDEEDEDTVCTPRVPKGLSPSSRNIPPLPRIPYSSSILARHSDGRVDGTPRRHRVSRLSPSMEGDSPCASVSPWIQWGREEEWIKLGDTLLRRVCNRMIPKQISPPPLFRRLACFDPTRYSS